MQIDQIRIADFLNTDATKESGAVSVSASSAEAGKVNATEVLRSISVDNPFYDKNSVTDSSFAEQLSQGMSMQMDAKARVDEIAVYAGTTSAEDLQQMSEDGFNAMDTEVDTVVTVVDRVKLALAKGGTDISNMGGLSDEIIEEIEGNLSTANMIENKLKSMDLPVDKEVMSEVETAVLKAEEVASDATIKASSASYLIKNELQPTINNVYQATFAAGSATYSTNDSYSAEASPNEEMQKAFEDVLTEANLEATEENINDCQWLLEQDIPITAKNIDYLQQLRDVELNLNQEEIAEIICDAIAEGKEPGEAVYVSDYSMMAQARQAYEIQQEQIDQISSTLVREQARMIMSVEANFQLIKQGITIDTQTIQDTIEALEELEQKFLEGALSGNTPEETAANVDMYRDFENLLSEAKDSSATVLAQFSSNFTSITTMSVSQLTEAAKESTASFKEMQQRYETLWTAPRADMGDSIQKAFANVDDILEDLDFELNDANRRAVRILAYNQEEISAETISNVRAADAEVQRLFAALKPATVMEMIREGENPLDMSIADLTETAENMSGGTDSQSEGFAEFLWQMEKIGEITSEEREGFIGIYRLIHQVEENDGAAIGALLAQGAEVTLRNLMMAVRSEKHTGRDYQIDDSFGELEAFDSSKLSITDQIEMAYQRRCLQEAGEELTPVKMQQFDSEDAYMNLTPEGFRDALAAMDDEQIQQAEAQLEQEYSEELRQEFARALESEQQIFDLLEEYEIPQTPYSLLAMNEFMKNRNGVFQNLSKYVSNQASESAADVVEDMIDELIRRFGEAVKTPEEMAEAQRNLQDTAENVMKNMLVEQDVTTIDVRGMKLVMTEIKTLGQISDKSETYNIPIMVADEAGTLSLKIVRGQHEAGMVDVSFNSNRTGNVYASFRYEAGQINGQIEFENRSTQQTFSDNAGMIIDNMSESVELPVRLGLERNRDVNANDIFGARDYDFETTEERDEISTRVLYGVAKSFIDSISQMF